MGKITGQSQRAEQVSPEFLPRLQSREYFEAPLNTVAPDAYHRGSVNVYRLAGEASRAGLLECRDCRKPIQCGVCTVMEEYQPYALSTWAKACHLMLIKKGISSSFNFTRQLGIGSYRTAWHLAHRIREAMRCEPRPPECLFDCQAEVTYAGGEPGRGHFATHKPPGLARTSSGQQGVGLSLDRAVKPPDPATLNESDGAISRSAIRQMVDQSATIHTDELNRYHGIGNHFAGGHVAINHSNGQYVGPNGETTNTAESYFALLKRGVMGQFHHVSKKHLHRYCDEFAFRWNGRTVTDVERRDDVVKGAEGKRLMYRDPIKG